MNCYRYQFFPRWLINDVFGKCGSVSVEAAIIVAKQRGFLVEGTVHAHSAEDAMAVVRVEYNPFDDPGRKPVFLKLECVEGST